MGWDNSVGDNWDTGNDGDVAGVVNDWNGGDTVGANDQSEKLANGVDDHNCRICGESGHLARQCPKSTGSAGCFNCGEAGHNKNECTKEKAQRPFTGECRICGVTGHSARNCEQKEAEKCRNCKTEGHVAKDCTAPRPLDYSGVPDMSPEDAWNALKAADENRDLDDFRSAFQAYCKAIRDSTYDQLEKAFRTNEFNVYLIAKEKQIFPTQTIINLQGKLDCKYEVGFHLSPKPTRKTAKVGWPESPEENLERLKDAGITSPRGVPMCLRCNELGHVSKDCTEEAVEIERVEVKCANCEEVGHRVRDCPKERPDRFACRNCKQSGHNAADCTEPRSAEGVECRKCKQTGHFSNDCPVPDTCRNCGKEGHMSKECSEEKNPANITCRNCEQMGHFVRDCPKPRDWSKVQCNNCKEYGHTVVRCKAPKAEDGDTAPEINNWGAKYDGDAVNDGGAVNGGEYANGVDFVDTTANDEWGSTAETGAW